ncbi:MAG: hypothetical protein ABSD78_18705 [Acidimicrobiales bacterium]|jgi:hypothetical protein
MADVEGDRSASSTGDARPVRLAAPIEDLREREFQLLFGAWSGLEPAAVGELLSGVGFRWWIAGGHAVEAAGGASRPHGDSDVAVGHLALVVRRRSLG